MELDLRAAKLENNNRLDPSELDELQMQTAQLAELQI